MVAALLAGLIPSYHQSARSMVLAIGPSRRTRHLSRLRGYWEAGIEALIEDHLTEGRRSVLLSRERPAGHCPHLLADACQGPLQDIDAATAAVAIERVLVGCDRRHLYAAQERRDRGEPMTSEDLQAH